eukprot:c4754_g1_i2.p1 GENE.c4754_g1_i2~~c4754_g1_i2.p1  ORF type:complete len:337 (+),score=87.16 c4754_g1_i2:54-1064(+)
MTDLGDLLAAFAEVDTRNQQFITVKQFNVLSSKIALSGDNVDITTAFNNGVVTFAELVQIAGIDLPSLPITVNLVAESFRKLSPSAKDRVSLPALTQKLGYWYHVDVNLEDTEVAFSEALVKVSAPRQELRLNIFKDIFRRFGKDGDGTLSNSEFAFAMRFLEIDATTDIERITMNDLLQIVMTNKDHPIFQLQVNMNEVRKAFDWCDLDHNGTLDSNELAKAMRLAGQNPSQAEFKRLKAEFDQNGDGVFDFHEFTDVICRSFMSADEMRQKAKEAFAVFDTDNSGYITLDELRRIMTTYGEDMQDDEVEALFKEIDTNEDGKLDINEFVELLLT